tara:strand:+ start:1093 stop:2373 length:1281 start_codon:yes stop_codon:yes gene_type:complete
MSELNNEEISVPRKMVAWLFREDNLSLGFWNWLKLLSATCIIRNRNFSNEFFDALSDKISASFDDPNLSDLKKDIILYNALSFFAFADPQDEQTLTIHGIQYSIEKIELTSGWLSSSYYAYGLKALDSSNAQSILVFQGTTTPADHGFLAGLLADTRPFGSIGTQLYARGQEPIQNWINAENDRTQKRVLCTGQSLGGAMSLHAHIHQPDKVDYFICNPPGLTNREKTIYENNQSSLVGDQQNRVLSVVSHHNDPVLKLGSIYFPEGTKIYRHGEKDENSILAHAKTPDCSKNAPELDYVVHDNSHRVKSYGWKIIKVFLHLFALTLLTVALPFRILIKIKEEIFHSNSKQKPSNNQSNEQNTAHTENYTPSYEYENEAEIVVDLGYEESSAPRHFFGVQNTSDTPTKEQQVLIDIPYPNSSAQLK